MTDETKHKSYKEIIKKNVAIAEKMLFNRVTVAQYVRDKINPNIDLESNPSHTCILHDENEPSFRYHRDTNSWACYGACGTGGNVVKLHELYAKKLFNNREYLAYKKLTTVRREDLTYYTALEDLCKQYGLDIPNIFKKEEKVVKEVTLDDFRLLFNMQVPKPKCNDLLSIDYMNREIENMLIKLKGTQVYYKMCKEKDRLMMYGDTLDEQAIKDIMKVIFFTLKNELEK